LGSQAQLGHTNKNYLHRDRNGGILTNDELSARLRRVYAALDATLETDIGKAHPVIQSDGKCIGIFQDFRGSLSDAQMENLSHSIIHNLANLRDHIRRWMKRNGQDPNQVNTFISANLPIAILQDLSDNDKHGYPRRNGGISKKSPNPVNVRRIMQLSTGTEPNSSIGVTITPSGDQRIFGSGSATLIITGDVMDERGNIIGDLHVIQSEALSAWEGLLRSLGLLK
jgi:hypothetical protein